MHKNCDVALFLVLCLIMRRKFIGGSDQKLLEISASNVAPILNVSKRLFIADPISHTIGIDVRSNATLAAIIDHPILWHFGERASGTKSMHQTFYKIWELKFKTSFWCVGASLIAKFVFAGRVSRSGFSNPPPMWRSGRRNGLKIAVLATSVLCALFKSRTVLRGYIAQICEFLLFVRARAEISSF